MPYSTTGHATADFYDRSLQLPNHSLHSVSPVGFLGRLRYQLVLGALLTVALPFALYHNLDMSIGLRQPHAISTASGAATAFAIAVYLFRRVITFPGVGIVGHVLPAVTAGYGLVLAIYFGLRLEYTRLLFGMSFASAILFFFFVSNYVRHRKGQRFYIVPSPSTLDLAAISQVEWIVLKEPKLPRDSSAVLIADLRADLGPQWERLIADTAVAGHSVYHIKQVQESLTGRVQIEHLSENSFGSLIPNLSYRKIKRMVDLALAVIALPFMLLLGLFIGIAIKAESPGPILFRQKRQGYRGCPFEVIKFRTMKHPSSAAESAERESSITQLGDLRITRFGHFLRRTRIDELPQIWNVLKGEMSWIGPRPEAMPLSEWYEGELPFYSYRHIVRPGITGWAQVNQGHVADLGAVYAKLHYDFYYIKNFSAWLDILIFMKTVSIVLSGRGAK